MRMCTVVPDNQFPGLAAMSRRWAAGAAVLSSTLLSGFLQGAEQEAPPDAFVALFSTTCMKYYNSQEQLRSAMKASGMAELAGDAARFFLNGKPGIAWSVPIEEQRYVVTLREDGVCTTFRPASAGRVGPEELYATGFQGNCAPGVAFAARRAGRHCSADDYLCVGEANG